MALSNRKIVDACASLERGRNSTTYCHPGQLEPAHQNKSATSYFATPDSDNNVIWKPRKQSFSNHQTSHYSPKKPDTLFVDTHLGLSCGNLALTTSNCQKNPQPLDFGPLVSNRRATETNNSLAQSYVPRVAFGAGAVNRPLKVINDRYFGSDSSGNSSSEGGRVRSPVEHYKATSDVDVNFPSYIFCY